jgi:hypothetical protein
MGKCCKELGFMRKGIPAGCVAFGRLLGLASVRR